MDWIEELEKLNSLREQGILTETEFNEEKSRVLSTKNEPIMDSPRETLGSPPNITSESLRTPVAYQEAKIQLPEQKLIIGSLAIFAIGVFISIFLKWVDLPGERNDYVPKNFDQVIVLTLFQIVFVSLIAFSLLFFGPSGKRDSRLLGFLTPILVISLIPSLWSALDLFMITPLRSEVGWGEYYDALGPGAFVGIICTIFPLLALSLILKPHIEKQKFDSWPVLKRDSSIVVPVAVLAILGALYGFLKVNPNVFRYADFAPFVDTYKVPWEIWFNDGLIEPILFIAASVIVAKFANPTIRDAGVLGFFYYLISQVFYLIAWNAETGDSEVWTFGGTLLVLATIILGLVLLSNLPILKRARQQNINQQGSDLSD